MWNSIRQWLLDRYEQAQQWIYDFFLWIPRKVWAEFLDELADFLETIGAPDFLTDAAALLSSWGQDAGYWFDLLQFNWGISAVMTAFGMRYAWSKMPFIGSR